MKTIKSMLKLGMIAVLICSLTEGFAQFSAANDTDVPFGANDCRLSGNDLIMDGTDEVSVHVWDNANGSSGFAYRVNTGTPTPLTLTSSTGMDPDVALVKDGNGRIHALVVYYDATGSDYILDVLNYVSGVFSLFSTTQISSNVSFGTAVNIDAEYPSGEPRV